ncbi:hypothetical protein BGW38_006595 [Lunasporangiospora selenospora]|uniref:Crinkler effector protein N-terminal domain-containing protein n=1 Tax=Lunasporangiospora selenospora TaxID=979761 RepID=A0A9P6FLN5_9FUNG|nr:hypothetical protein BGW38_006595 [Lunasporangiospora selenospora]
MLIPIIIVVLLLGSMSRKTLIIFCLVDGDPTARSFPVSVSAKTTIGELKELIKTKKAIDFLDIDADKLTLWLVSHSVIPINKHNAVLLSAIDSPTELEPTDSISDIFKEEPVKKTIHIIVQRPPPPQSIQHALIDGL